MKTRLIFLLLAAGLIGGCMSLTVSETRPPRIVARNCGWTLFGFIPLVCGNANHTSWMPWTFFWNDVSETQLEKAIAVSAAARDLHVRKTTVEDNGSVFLTVPACKFALPIPYFITYRDLTVSATLITREERKASEDAQRLKREMQELLQSLPTN